MKITVAVKTKDGKWQIGFVIVGDVYGNVTQSELKDAMKEKWPDIMEAKVLETVAEDPINV